MTATHGMTEGSSEAIAPVEATPADAGSRPISVLLYSSDRAVRDSVRLGVGDRPAPDVRIETWLECATPAAVLMEVTRGDFDVLILDGESQPYGGMGISRQLKDEIFQCPPLLVLIGRPQDAWLATWSRADAAVSHPIDPVALAEAVVALLRSRVPAAR